MPTEIPTKVSPPEPPERTPLSTTPAQAEREEGTSALRIATIAGIPIRLHFTFLLLLAWITALSFSTSEPNLPRWFGPFMIVALFTCVVLHELAHALTARRYGIRTRDIVLYPIGGIASLEQHPPPRQEFWIALAGPAVNLGIAFLCYLGLRLSGQPIPGFYAASGAQGVNIVANLMWANLALCGFNLIPAFPMDGGRVLRAALAHITDETRATAIAARIGQLVAILFGVYAIRTGNWLLLFVAAFVYFSAGQEASAFQARALLMGHRVRDAMLREFHTLTVGTTLREAAETLLAGSQQDFPVVYGGNVVGVLSRSALMRGMAAEGPEGYVAGVMQRDFAWARPDDDLETALMQVQDSSSGPVLVMEEGGAQDEGHLIGMLTQQNVLEFLTLTQIESHGARPA